MESDTTQAPAIGADRLGKRYGRRRGVTDISFTVEPGQICALLGPNGSGKTTTMRMLVGLSRPEQGIATLLGHRVHLGSGVLRRVGVLIDGPAFVPHLSGQRNLRLMWSAAGQQWPPPALEAALALAGLGDAVDRKAKSYSMGMKQRLMLAQALMGAPDILILDEPANGLDPAEVRALRQRLAELTSHGVAVLISSHQLAEVQLLATHAVVLNQGQLVAAGTLTHLLGTDSYQFEVDDPTRAAELLRARDDVASVAITGNTLTVTAPNSSTPRLTHVLVTAGVGVISVQEKRSLEDAFLTMVGDDNVAR